MRAAFRIWVTIVFAAAVAQVAFAGYGAFYAADKVSGDSSIDEKGFEDGFGLHIGFGYLIFLSTIILLILALIARPGKRIVIQSAVVVGLLVVQIVSAWIGEEVPAVGGLHPLNAFIIVGLLGALTWREWSIRKGGQMTAETAVAETSPA